MVLSWVGGKGILGRGGGFERTSEWGVDVRGSEGVDVRDWGREGEGGEAEEAEDECCLHGGF